MTSPVGGFIARDLITWRLGRTFELPDVQFNGTDAWGVDWVLEGTPDGWDTDVVEVPQDSRAGDGANLGPGRRPERVLTLRGAFRARSSADVQAAAERLKLACECFRTDAVLAHGGAAPKYVTVRRTGALHIDFIGRRGATFSFVLTAGDPYKYAAGATGLVRLQAGLPRMDNLPGITFGAAGSAFPWDFGGGQVEQGQVAAVNPGNVEVHPLVTFTGPVPKPELRHHVQSKFIGLSSDVPAGVDAVIAHRAGRITVGGSSAFSQRAPGSTFFALTPGANDLRFTAPEFNSTALVTVEYRPRWS